MLLLALKILCLRFIPVQKALKFPVFHYDGFDF